MILLAFFSALICIALWATWRDADLRAVGCALVISWLLSIGLWLTNNLEDRAAVYTMGEVITITAAGLALRDKYRLWLVALACINVASICFNVALAIKGTGRPEYVNLHGDATNIIFGLECLAAFLAGVGERGYLGPGLGIRNVGSHADGEAGSA